MSTSRVASSIGALAWSERNARILDEASDRGWVDSEGSTYWLTPLGEAMVTEFQSAMDRLEGYTHLGELVNHLPPPMHDLDVRHLRDATLVQVTEQNPGAPFTRTLDAFRDASVYRGLNNTSLPQHLRLLHERATAGDLDFEQVIEADFLDAVRDDADRADRWTDVAADVWAHPDPVPINLHIVDDTRVFVWLGDTRGEVEALLETDDPHVRDWAQDRYEEYRSNATGFDGF